MGEPLLIIDAARSYGKDGENRRTELLATGLDAHMGLCEALAKRLGLSPGSRYIIETQRWVSQQTRVDLSIKAYSESGARTSTIYSEHKIEGYGFSEGQVERERSALDHEPGNGKRLICVIPVAAAAQLEATTGSNAQAPPSHAFDSVLTWEEVTALIDDAGRGYHEPWGRQGWSERALEPEAPACQRILAELLFYLKGEETLSSLTDEEIHAFQLADQANEKITNLMILASSKASPYVAVEDEKQELVFRTNRTPEYSSSTLTSRSRQQLVVPLRAWKSQLCYRGSGCRIWKWGTNNLRGVVPRGCGWRRSGV